jgi:hypothetical protein
MSIVDPTGDEAIRQTEEAELAKREAKAMSLFDLRKVIGAVLLVYGLVLTGLGIFGSTAEKHKAAGININLWTGLALVLVALFMLVWAYTRPLIPDEEEATRRGSGRLRKAA